MEKHTNLEELVGFVQNEIAGYTFVQYRGGCCVILNVEVAELSEMQTAAEDQMLSGTWIHTINWSHTTLLCTDRGTENRYVENMLLYFVLVLQEIASFIYERSTANHRLKKNSPRWHFSSDALDKSLIPFCFINLIQACLQAQYLDHCNPFFHHRVNIVLIRAEGIIMNPVIGAHNSHQNAQLTIFISLMFCIKPTFKQSLVSCFPFYAGWRLTVKWAQFNSVFTYITGLLMKLAFSLSKYFPLNTITMRCIQKLNWFAGGWLCFYL